MKRRYVLDAWAILALLQGEEPAASRVVQLLKGIEQCRAGGSERSEVLISIINLGEVYYRIGRVRGEKEAEDTLESLRRLDITVVPVDEQAVLSAARVKTRHAVSYADAFAVAAAQQASATLVTGDPELIRIRLVPIERLTRNPASP
jgi:uncharacterized protein